MLSTPNRTALGVLATAALAGTLISCSSSSDAPATEPTPSADVANPHASAAPLPPATGDPASAADQAEMTAVFERYVDTSNNGDAQAYLATVCSTDPVHTQGITDQGPAAYPVTVEEMKDFTVGGDDGQATVTVKINAQPTSQELTSRFTFVRESGGWTVCGELGG